MNNIFNKHGFIILAWGFIMILPLQSNLAQESDQNNDDFLSLISGHPAAQELVDQIINVLNKNIEKSQKINQRQEQRFGMDGSLPSKYELYCTEFHLFQKQMELFQWQYQRASDGDARDDMVQQIISTYTHQIESAKEMVNAAAKCRKTGRLENDDYIDTERMLDQTVREQLDFLSINQTEEDYCNQILRFLEHNVEKAESITKDFQDINEHPKFLLVTPFAKIHAELYLFQKQIELQRWQYENVEDNKTHQIVSEDLLATYERQLVATQKLVDMSKELFQQYGITTGEYISCEILCDQANVEMINFKSISLMKNTEDKTGIVAKMTQTLQNQLEKAKRIDEAYQKEYNKPLLPGKLKRFTTLGLYQTKLYFQQKQTELFLWQLENAKDASTHKILAEQIMAMYKKQWDTTNQLMMSAQNAKDVGVVSMKEYLDSENCLDRTTFEMLTFALENHDLLFKNIE